MALRPPPGGRECLLPATERRAHRARPAMQRLSSGRCGPVGRKFGSCCCLRHDWQKVFPVLPNRGHLLRLGVRARARLRGGAAVLQIAHPARVSRAPTDASVQATAQIALKPAPDQADNARETRRVLPASPQNQYSFYNRLLRPLRDMKSLCFAKPSRCAPGRRVRRATSTASMNGHINGVTFMPGSFQHLEHLARSVV